MSAPRSTHRLRTAPAILAVLVMGIAFLKPAAAQPPPAPAACDEQDSGERIKCKFGNIIDQQMETAEMIMFNPNVPESQKKALMSQAQRTNRKHGRTSAEEFKQITKKSKTSCQILEVANDGIGDDDGICKGNEDCVEVIGDQIGDDDGICKPRNGKKREVCVEVCDDEAINSDPDNFDDDPTQDSLGRDVEEQLDEVTDQYMEINEMLEEEMQLQAAARVLAANGDECAAVFAARPNPILEAALIGAADGTRGGADILERFCDQTVFGTSSSAFCSIIEGIAAVAKLAASTLQFGDASVDSDTIDSTYSCLQSLNTSVGQSNDALTDVQNSINSLDQQVKNLKQQLESVQQELTNVQTLLSTPLGRREDFPKGAASSTE